MTLLNAALAGGGDPTRALRSITRLDRVVLLLALIVIYLGLAVSARLASPARRCFGNCRGGWKSTSELRFP